MSLELVGRLLGGIGLFLLGMRLMTEGLKVAAGRALREVLMRSTRTRLRGVLSGFLVTALVQSSSAITVATIGFVNAGLLTLGQALAVTYGSNIGTTMTGWLVAAARHAEGVPLVPRVRLLAPIRNFSLGHEREGGRGVTSGNGSAPFRPACVGFTRVARAQRGACADAGLR